MAEARAGHHGRAVVPITEDTKEHDAADPGAGGSAGMPGGKGEATVPGRVPSMATIGGARRLADVDDFMLPWDEVAGSDPDALSMSDTRAMIYFDVLFFANYSIGWLLTYKYQPRFAWDNNVTRAFGVVNICVGVDSFPARPVASWLFNMAFPFYFISCYLSYRTLQLEELAAEWADAIATSTTGQPRPRRCMDQAARLCCPRSRWRCPRPLLMARYVLLVVSVLLASGFVITYSVPPDTAEQAFIHILAFAAGLTGYALLKLYRLLALWTALQPHARHRFHCHMPVAPPDRSCKTALYAGSLFVQAAYFLITVAALVASLAALDTSVIGTVTSYTVPATIDGGAELGYEEVQSDLFGNLLVFIAMVGPIIQWFTEPHHMKYRLQVKLNPQHAVAFDSAADDGISIQRHTCCGISQHAGGTVCGRAAACCTRAPRLLPGSRVGGGGGGIGGGGDCRRGCGACCGLIVCAMLLFNAASLPFVMPPGLIPAAGDLTVATNVTWEHSPPHRDQTDACDAAEPPRWCLGYEVGAPMGYLAGYRGAKIVADPALFLGPHIVVAVTLLGLIAAVLFGHQTAEGLAPYFFPLTLALALHVLPAIRPEAMPNRTMGLPINELAVAALILLSLAGIVCKLALAAARRPGSRAPPGFAKAWSRVLRWAFGGAAAVLLTAPGGQMSGMLVAMAAHAASGDAVWPPPEPELGNRPHPSSGHGVYAAMGVPLLGHAFVLAFGLGVAACILAAMRRRLAAAYQEAEVVGRSTIAQVRAAAASAEARARAGALGLAADGTGTETGTGTDFGAGSLGDGASNAAGWRVPVHDLDDGGAGDVSDSTGGGKAAHGASVVDDGDGTDAGTLTGRDTSSRRGRQRVAPAPDGITPDAVAPTSSSARQIEYVSADGTAPALGGAAEAAAADASALAAAAGAEVESSSASHGHSAADGLAAEASSAAHAAATIGGDTGSGHGQGRRLPPL